MSKDTKIKELKNALKDEAVKETVPSKEDMKVLETILKEARMPVVMNDKDFVCGEQELDIRELSLKNKEQMLMRMLILNNVYQRQIAQSLVDLMRLVMIVCEKLGVTDIVKATDDLMDKLSDQVKTKAKPKQDNKA